MNNVLLQSLRSDGIKRACKLFMLILLAQLPSFSYGQASKLPEEIESPLSHGIGNYIYDEGNYISSATEKILNGKIDDLKKKTTAEVALAVLPTTGDIPIEDYAYRLFKHWGVGKSDKNNGVLVLLAVKDRKARIEVGSGAEGVLTDIACYNILHNDVGDAMREGNNVGQALNAAVESISEAMTVPDVAKELQSKQGETAMGNIRTIHSDVIWQFLLIVICLVFTFTLVLFFIDLFSGRGKGNYAHAIIWRNHIPTYAWSLIFSCGTTLPIFILAWCLYRHSRDVKEICQTCGSKMNKLSEDEDNLLLSDSQDFEEKIGTVDYDVWVCPDCGTVERFPYHEKQLKYRECPDCHTVAMRLSCSKVTLPATVKHTGMGQRIYTCEYCGKRHVEDFEIPKKPDPTAAVIAGSILGSATGRGGSGGGFSGGSFGGGHSSGGGATGGW